MTAIKQLAFSQEPTDIPSDPDARHEAFVEFFGQYLFWLRNWALDASRKLIESQETRENLGSIRRQVFDAVGDLPAAQRDAAMRLAEETLNGFTERLTWFLGDEGTDSRFGTRHAYRFRIEMEIVDVVTGRIVDEETINRGGKFFGSYWGKWLNRFNSQ
jgi:hypothetical protein